MEASKQELVRTFMNDDDIASTLVDKYVIHELEAESLRVINTIYTRRPNVGNLVLGHVPAAVLALPADPDIDTQKQNLEDVQKLLGADDDEFERRVAEGK